VLSKSQYTKYLQCPKLFWLYRNDRDKLTPPSVLQQQIFDTGSAVGDLAQQLFPGGTEVPFDVSDVPGMVQKTQNLIDGGATVVYEASFLFDDLFAAVDILIFSQGKWHIYEVKSSTGVKETYLDDAAVQMYVLKQAGINVGTVNVVHINNRYVRKGDLNIQELFSIVNVTKAVLQRQKPISGSIAAMKNILNGSEPDVPIGPHCFQPYDCSACDYCWKTLAKVPDDSVFTLTRALMEQKFELYHAGIIKLSDVPLEDRTPMQIRQISGREYTDKESLQSFIAAFRYPVAHLDFETFQQAVPEYDGLRAFQQIPFQYSIHIETLNESDGRQSLEHKEFLAPVGVDPRRLLAEQLIQDLPAEGTILAYNRSFETGVIKRLAETCEDLSESLLSIAHRIEDLMIPFQKGWVYHPGMNGSYSIKKVLPALVPEMGKAYKDLPVVHDGGEASSLWSSLPFYEDPEEVETIRRGLLEYCKLDTLAMVEILKVLRKISH